MNNINKIRLTESQLYKTIERCVNEALNEIGNASLKRKYINKLYRAIEKSGLTSRLYNDDYWLGKDKVCELISNFEGVTNFEVTVKMEVTGKTRMVMLFGRNTI